MAATPTASVVVRLEDQARQLYVEISGSDCFTESESLLAPNAGPTQAEISVAGISSGWLVENQQWMGSLDDLMRELGGDLVGRRGDIAWALVSGIRHPYAQEVMRAHSAGATEVWLLVDQIRTCDDPTWGSDGIEGNTP